MPKRLIAFQSNIGVKPDDERGAMVSAGIPERTLTASLPAFSPSSSGLSRFRRMRLSDQVSVEKVYRRLACPADASDQRFPRVGFAGFVDLVAADEDEVVRFQVRHVGFDACDSEIAQGPDREGRLDFVDRVLDSALEVPSRFALVAYHIGGVRRWLHFQGEADR